VYIVFPAHSPSLYPFLISSPSHWYQPTRQDLFAFQFFFVKALVFLFVHDSYTGCFIVVLPCIYVLKLELLYLLYFSPFYLSPILIVISTDSKILYSFLYRKYINHVHLLNFLLLPSFSDLTSP
jgi:hypothetical protein